MTVEASRPQTVEIVVKVGGALLRHPDHLRGVLASIGASSQTTRLLIVPGGGPFADAVREAFRTLPLSDDAAHWMAVLAMDQHAHLIVSTLPASVLVSSPAEIAAASGAGRIPVLAPSAWLQAVDPLPHTWEVTSDSISAWVAGVLGARKLVLVKPPQADGPEIVDPHFDRVKPSAIDVHVIAADRTDDLRAALDIT